MLVERIVRHLRERTHVCARHERRIADVDLLSGAPPCKIGDSPCPRMSRRLDVVARSTFDTSRRAHHHEYSVRAEPLCVRSADILPTATKPSGR